MPIKLYTVLDPELPSRLGFPITPNQFSVLLKNEVVESEPDQEQNLEDPKLTRAQRL